MNPKLRAELKIRNSISDSESASLKLPATQISAWSDTYKYPKRENVDFEPYVIEPHKMRQTIFLKGYNNVNVLKVNVLLNRTVNFKQEKRCVFFCFFGVITQLLTIKISSFKCCYSADLEQMLRAAAAVAGAAVCAFQNSFFGKMFFNFIWKILSKIFHVYCSKDHE